MSHPGASVPACGGCDLVARRNLITHRADRADEGEPASGEVMRTLASARIVPDIVFGAGALLLLEFVGLAIWLSRARNA